jgi:hypothetical protein
MWLELGTISILKQDLPVPGTSSHPVEIPTKLLKIRALWPRVGDSAIYMTDGVITHMMIEGTIIELSC